MASRPIDVRHVAELARLQLTDDEVRTFAPQLDAVLGYAEKLRELDVEGIEPTAHAAAVFDHADDDIPAAGLGPAALLANAPDCAAGQLRVPKVVADA